VHFCDDEDSMHRLLGFVPGEPAVLKRGNETMAAKPGIVTVEGLNTEAIVKALSDPVVVAAIAASLAKQQPDVGDVHAASAGGGERRKKKPKGRLFDAIIGEVKPKVSHPDTGIGDAGLGKGVADVLKAEAPRELKTHSHDESKAHSPFPHDPQMMDRLRADQVQRFMRAVTNPEELEDRTLPIKELTAMQDRIDPDKVEAMRGQADMAPPVVVRNERKNYIADGHHRAAAAWLDGENSIPVKFTNLSRAEPEADEFDAVHDTEDAAVAALEKRGARFCPECGAAVGDGDPHEADCSHASDDSKLDKGLDEVDWNIPFEISKQDPDERLVFGYASVVMKDGHLVVDKQDDVILPEDLEFRAYEFVLNARAMGDMHLSKSVGRLVESMVFTLEKQDVLGVVVKNDQGQRIVPWWIGFYVDDDETWDAHKRGERPEFSIGGRGVRMPLDEA
jgi:hypothetical protein